MGEDQTPMTEHITNSLQHLAIQKQSAQRQRIELESALEELDTDVAWKVVGNIMVKKDPEVLKKELNEKLETVTQRLEQYAAQEKRLQDKLNEHASN